MIEQMPLPGDRWPAAARPAAPSAADVRVSQLRGLSQAGHLTPEEVQVLIRWYQGGPDGR